MIAMSEKNYKKWFEQCRFGLFIHWGLYAMRSAHEWQQSFDKMPTEEYEKLYFNRFEPDLYDPVQWAETARGAGMKYVVITAKHHDGFCMWDTEYSDFNSMKAPLCRRDLIGEAVTAFRNAGIKIGIYYSLPDWHHPNYVIDARHPLRDNKVERDYLPYREFLHNQVMELMQKYNPDILWFDGDYPDTRHIWDAPELNRKIREANPDILINRLPGFSDFLSPEQNIPDGNDNMVCWEGCQVFRGSAWGYNRDDDHCKSSKEIVQMLIRHVSKGGNLLLNVGPDARGNFPETMTERLLEVGKWMRLHSRAVYNCTMAPAGIIPPQDCHYTWNSETDRLYLHIFSYPDRRVRLCGINAEDVEYAQLLNDGSYLTLGVTKDRININGAVDQAGSVIVNLPVKQPDVAVPVVELFMKKNTSQQ